MSIHAAIWIDHKEARIFHLEPEHVVSAHVMAPPHHIHHKHPKGPEGVKEHPDDAKRFFHDVARSLEGSEKVLVVGPSTAKLDFIRYVHKYQQALESKIVGVETVDHPTDGQLVAYSRKYFEHPGHLGGDRSK